MSFDGGCSGKGDGACCGGGECGSENTSKQSPPGHQHGHGHGLVPHMQRGLSLQKKIAAKIGKDGTCSANNSSIVKEMPTTTTQTASYYFIIFAIGMLFAWLIKQYRYSHTTKKNKEVKRC